MSNLSYWERRQAQRMFEYMQAAEDAADEISKLYYKASGYINHEIDQVFGKFRSKHALSDAEAYRILNTLRDKASLDELRQALRAVGPNSETRAAILADLEGPAYQARLERLQQIQSQLDQTMRNVYNQERVLSSSHYAELGREVYYRTVFDVQQRIGTGFPFFAIDHKAIDRIINSKWSGSNYSGRIWRNTQGLAKSIKEELLASLITGRTDREAADIIANKFASGASAARRLVRTESCFLANQMEMISYEECGVEYYRFVATLDLRTSEVCRSLDGKRFKVSEQQPGSNCPPMHPWCRSTTICDISNSELIAMQRRARNPETGKAETVPADMTYAQWYKKYVAGRAQITAREKVGERKSVAKTSSFGTIGLRATKEVLGVHTIGKIDREIYKCITEDIVTDEIIITDERIGHIKTRHPNDFERYYEYLTQAVISPDYIIESNKPSTALVLKEFVGDDSKRFKAIVRLKTSTDNPEFKNSVITFMKINEKEWNRLIRNKQVLYKKE
ncbi:minor capsid protein [Hominifimenecus sp. rT4P-3]|uniref:minor capsid protein n=1 Tax=Hominifimenecus sp. rT4P-3 TaxID=3242979 RepID=UPI003DA208DC